MFELDFVSVVVGYIIGVVLCYHTTHLLFVEANDESER